MTTLLVDNLSDSDSKAALVSRIENREQADQLEKDSIIKRLKETITDRKETVKVALQSLFISRAPGSTFDDVNEPARIALVKIIDELRIRQMNLMLGRPLIGFDEQSGFFHQADVDRRPLTHGQADSSAIEDELGMLTECAAQTGGYLFSGEVISVHQWLRFNKYILPTSVAETKNLIAFLEFKLPSSPPLGDYHELLRSPADSPFHLSVADRSIIKEVCAQAASGRDSLLQFLNIRNFNVIPAFERRQHAAVFLETLLGNSKAKALGMTLHERLEWHLETDDSATTERQLKLMVAAALIISLSPSQGPQANAAYEVYRPETAEWTAEQVRDDLERYLVDSGRVDADHAPLAAYLLLCGSAPECVVQQTPAELTLDKPVWVALTQAVALIELTAPGASRLLSYTQIMAFAELSPVTIELQELHEVTAILPILNWAVMNGVVPYRAEKDYNKETLLSATAYFTQYIDALHQSGKGLTSAPPDRRKLGLAELEKLMPKGRYLEQKAFRFNYQGSIGEKSWLDAFNFINPAGVVLEGYDYAVSEIGIDEIQLSKVLRLRFSILDLYLSGDLLENGQLSRRFKSSDDFNPPAGAFADVSRLPALDALYEAAFEQYYKGVQESLASVIKMSIASLPESDRYALNNGNLSLYTVRQEISNFTPGFETQKQRDEMKGRYGLIVCSSIGNEHRCYELFTLRGLCRERPALLGQLQSSGIIDEVASLSFVGARTDFQPKKRWQLWSLDFAAYRDGSEPRSGEPSRVVVEKLWQVGVEAEDIRPVALFFSPQLQNFANFIMTYHPVAPRQELYDAVTPRTELEQWRVSKEATQNAFLDLVVPFKKCVEDIKSGDAPRVVEGIGGCVLDGLSVLFLLIGLGATVVSVIAKTGSTTAKLLSIAKAGGRVVAALVNPVDGLPTLALKGARRVQRGLLLLSDGAVSAAHTASGQLRRLTGGQRSSDLLQAVRRADVNHGTWRAAENAVEAIDLAVLQRNNQWYALNLRTGGAWGPRLKNLKLGDFSPLRLFRKPKPHSYTRGYVKKAIPHAKGKLDNAISQLVSNAREQEIRDMAKCLFGSDTDEALTLIADNLRAMRQDLDRVTLANMSFRLPQGNALAALRPAAYKRWKTGIQTGAPLKGNAQKFIDIYPEVLDEHYRLSNFDDARLSDVLIHEMSHGAPDLLDLYYCRTISDKLPADYDVIGLAELARDARKAHPKNLSNPHYGLAHPPGFEEFEATLDSRRTIVRKNPALFNAESYSVAVAMLHQRATDLEVFNFNLSALRNALKNTEQGQFLKGTLLLNMTKHTH
jgi:hypothetical protein